MKCNAFRSICLFFIVAICPVRIANAQQNDSLKQTRQLLDSLLKVYIGQSEKEKDLTLTGTRVTEETDTTFSPNGKLMLGGYISAYYAAYTDSADANGFQKFPTVAPRNNAFGLNIAQLSAKYTSAKFRGAFTFHIGDIPQSAWSPQYNIIQEANVGFRIVPKLWVDAGFFRTHIGLESIQPRENITMSLATTTYFEPYYLSGAKLTWQATSKLTVQANVFNSFNTFIETNNNKAFGLSFVYEANRNLSFTFNSITCDETPAHYTRKEQRLYNNLYVIYKLKKFTIGFEINDGLQRHSKLTDSTATAAMASAMLAIKYSFTKKFACYWRGEFFSDPDEMLTGLVVDQDKKPCGLSITGTTLGMEIKLISNSYIRFEGRVLQTPAYEKIFYYNNKSLNQRMEGIAGVGIWF